MQKLSIFTLFIWLLTVTSLNAQANLKVKTVNGKKCSLHKVMPKETWTSVSKKYNLSIDDVKSVNQGINDLKIGQIINVPESSAEKQKRGVSRALCLGKDAFRQRGRAQAPTFEIAYVSPTRLTPSNAAVLYASANVG